MMPKSEVRKVNNRGKRRKLTEEQRRLLLMTPEEIERSDFSDDPLIRKIEELLKDFPLEVRRQWAEDWRKEHERGR